MPESRVTAGLDVGSRTIKIVFFNGSEAVLSRVVDNSSETLKLCEELLALHPYDSVIATGYGRELLEVNKEIPTVSEIKAFAVGVRHGHPGPFTVIDIGGQDTKFIRVGPEGKVLKFEMNDRCAAGTGRFFEVMAGTLGYALNDFSAIEPVGRPRLAINSMCTVFAESEVISLMSRGEDREDIARALHMAVVRRILPMVQKNHAEGEIYFCGGCAKNALLKSYLSMELGRKVLVPEDPQLMGALGASILAFGGSD